MARPARRPTRPAATPQERESQLTSLAYDLVEKRLVDGSATAQETIFFLRAGSQREALEQQKIQRENILLATRAEKMAQDAHQEQLLTDALRAFKSYSGNDDGYDVFEEELGGHQDL